MLPITSAPLTFTIEMLLLGLNVEKSPFIVNFTFNICM